MPILSANRIGGVLKDIHETDEDRSCLLYTSEISISIYDGEDFAIEFNHFRSIKGCFDKDSNIEIMENTLKDVYKRQRVRRQS